MIFSGHTFTPLTATGTYKYELKGQNAFTAETTFMVSCEETKEADGPEWRQEIPRTSNSKMSPAICLSSDFKRIAGRLRYFASARLLSMLIAISGVGGGARPMDA